MTLCDSLCFGLHLVQGHYFCIIILHLLRYSDLEQNVHEIETNAQWTNEKSVQPPSNTNLAGGYILITTVLCMGISEIQKTQLSGKFIQLGKLL